ncbi:hypothetical protein VaNZ11_010340 [Volvox africanus]|uniref:C2H2-type domain-containing protein n=1 Tax=Volvox africanus TaxID=51714 RepID=A0ABQ5S9B1_9CHLO|nr:hypothetical protein VaNZ11_010340 [Volvox africanus]
MTSPIINIWTTSRLPVNSFWSSTLWAGCRTSLQRTHRTGLECASAKAPGAPPPDQSQHQSQTETQTQTQQPVTVRHYRNAGLHEEDPVHPLRKTRRKDSASRRPHNNMVTTASKHATATSSGPRPALSSPVQNCVKDNDQSVSGAHAPDPSPAFCGFSASAISADDPVAASYCPARWKRQPKPKPKPELNTSLPRNLAQSRNPNTMNAMVESPVDASRCSSYAPSGTWACLGSRPHTPADVTTSATTRGHEGRSEDLVLSTGPVYVFWDLDNKYPETLDHRGLMDSMRTLLDHYGSVVEIRAYANHRTLKLVPKIWAAAVRAGMQHPLDPSGAASSGDDGLLRCPLCQRGVRGPESKLRTHFRQLHQRQHEKQLAQLSEADRRKYVQSRRFERYQMAAQSVLGKKRGYDLEGVLRTLGVKVKSVPMGRQKADVRLQKDAVSLLGEGSGGEGNRKAVSAPSASTSTSTPPCGPPPPPSSSPPVLVLVSDDHGFESLLKLFSSAGWRTVTVSNTEFKNAKERIPWLAVLNAREETEADSRADSTLTDSVTNSKVT